METTEKLIKRLEEQAVEIAALKAAMIRAIPFIGYTSNVPAIVAECERLTGYGNEEGR